MAGGNACHEGYHTMRHYGTTPGNFRSSRVLPKKRRKIAALPPQPGVRMVKEAFSSEAKDEKEGTPEHPGFLRKTGRATGSRRARRKAEAARASHSARGKTPFHLEEIREARRVNWKLGLLFAAIFAVIVLLLRRSSAKKP